MHRCCLWVSLYPMCNCIHIYLQLHIGPIYIFIYYGLGLTGSREIGRWTTVDCVYIGDESVRERIGFSRRNCPRLQFERNFLWPPATIDQRNPKMWWGRRFYLTRTTSFTSIVDPVYTKEGHQVTKAAPKRNYITSHFLSYTIGWQATKVIYFASSKTHFLNSASVVELLQNNNKIQ